MLSAEESAELLMLQAKAYGRGGGMTAAELARLQELERPALAPKVATSGSTGAGHVQPVAEPSQLVDVVPDSDPSASDEDEGDELADAVQKRQPRHPLVYILGAAAVALMLGIGAGWLVFGRDAGPAIPVTAEQQMRGEQLAEEANLDPGTITPMAEDDVLVWMGTRDEGEVTCMIIDDGEHDAPSCAPTESVLETGLYGMLARDASDSSQNATEVISASLGFVRAGEPIVMIQGGWTMSSGGDFLDQFADPDQRATAERLLDEGFDEWSPMLAAYDGDTQIWIGTREFGEQACLFYGGEPDVPSACAPMEIARTTGVKVMMPHPVGEPPSGISVTLRYTGQMTPSIVISHDSDASEVTVGPGSSDPIEFTFEDPASDDLSSEGETGETPR